jgi:hypothetical protein
LWRLQRGCRFFSPNFPCSYMIILGYFLCGVLAFRPASLSFALEETVQLTRSPPWPPPMAIHRWLFDGAPLLRYLRRRSADRWLPLDFRRSACCPAHPVVGRRSQRLAQRTIGRGEGTTPGTIPATAAPVPHMPANHLGRASCLIR